MIWSFLVFAARFVKGAESLGCYQQVVFPTVSFTDPVDSVGACLRKCQGVNVVSVIKAGYCSCSKTNLIPSEFTAVNSSFCSFSCTGESTSSNQSCGGVNLAGRIASLYIPLETEIIPNISSMKLSPAVTFSPSFTSNPSDIQPNATGIMVGLVSGIVMILFFTLILVIWKIRMNRKQRDGKYPCLEQGSNSALACDSDSNKFLIPEILVKTSNMIYSSFNSFTPRYQGELAIEQDDVVVVKKTYSDLWAFGVNLTSCKAGFFPLGCFVSDVGWIQDNLTHFEKRKESLNDQSTTRLSL